MRYVAMDEEFRVEDLAEALISAGYDETSTIGDVLKGAVGTARKHVSLDFEMDREDLVEHASSETLRSQLAGARVGGAADAEDAVRYLLAGERSLAGAMFSRVLDENIMFGVERALRS